MRGLWRGIFIGRDVDVKHQGVIGGLKANFPPKKKTEMENLHQNTGEHEKNNVSVKIFLKAPIPTFPSVGGRAFNLQIRGIPSVKDWTHHQWIREFERANS